METLKNFIFSSSGVVGKARPVLHKSKNEKINIYWGLKMDKDISINTLFFLTKLNTLRNLNCNIIILVADIHTLIDSSFNQTYNDTQIDFFINKIKNLINLFSTNDHNNTTITIIKGSQFQLDKAYILDIFKLISYYKINELCEDFKIDPMKSTFREVLHPLLQCLDEEYIKKHFDIDIDCQIGYYHQLKYYTFSKKNADKLDFKKRLYVLFDVPINLIYNPLYIYYNNLQYKYYLKSYTLNELLYIGYVLFEFCKNIDALIDNSKEIRKLGHCDNKEELIEKLSDFIPTIIKTIIKTINSI